MKPEVKPYSTKRWMDVFVDHRRFLVIVTVLVTALLACFAPGLQKDPSLKAMFVSDSPTYRQYEKFLEFFGNEEFIIVAIKDDREVTDHDVWTHLKTVTAELQKIDGIDEVRSLSNLRFFKKKGKRLGMYPVVEEDAGVPLFPSRPDMDKLRRAFPITDLLVSTDLKTVGILIQINDQWKHNHQALQRILDQIRSVVSSNRSQGSEYGLAGPPIIREAINRYSHQTAIIFGAICAIICVVVTIYTFKSFKVTAMTLLVLLMGVIWIIGFMSIAGIPLSSTTSMAFGIVMITTTLEMVIHLIVRYSQFREIVKDRIDAARETVRFLVRPFIMCSATTAVGFGTCAVSSIPIVYHFGIVMPCGIAVAWLLNLVMIPAFLVHTKSLDNVKKNRTSGYILDPLIRRAELSITKHGMFYIVFGVVFSAIMLAGVPFIRVESQLLRQLSTSNVEVADLAFVEKHLTSVHHIELMVEAGHEAAKSPEFWEKIVDLEDSLKRIPEVLAVDSFFHILEHLHSVLEGADFRQEDLLRKPGLLSQLLFLTTLGKDGKRLRARYVHSDMDKIHISVRINNDPKISLHDSIERIHSAAQSALGGTANIVPTGELVLVSEQGAHLVRSEMQSMVLATIIIAILMMIQMGTPLFGLISLMPNIPPLAAVFGIMGWFDIRLNSVTVFAANVALGLAVDNTIQYVNQLKREMKLNPDLGLDQCVFRAYRLAAGPMLSWSMLNAVGFLSLLVTPFLASIHFGILIAAAVLMGIFGDLFFMQSMIVRISPVARLIKKLIRKEISEKRF